MGGVRCRLVSRTSMQLMDQLEFLLNGMIFTMLSLQLAIGCRHHIQVRKMQRVLCDCVLTVIDILAFSLCDVKPHRQSWSSDELRAQKPKLANNSAIL